MFSTSFFQNTYTTIDDLPSELVTEVLVRIPPNPRCVLRASAACKNWRQFMGSKCFRNLTLSHNGGFPLLGFFTSSKQFFTEHDLDKAMYYRIFYPVKYVSASHSVLACRSGMVLLAQLNKAKGNIIAWEPMRDIVRLINKPRSLSKV